MKKTTQKIILPALIFFGLLVTQKLWLPNLIDGILILEDNTPESAFTFTTKTPDLYDEEMKITTTNDGVEFYTPHYVRLWPTDEITSVSPTGYDNTFTKEDAILAAKRKGFFKGQEVINIPNMINRGEAVKSGYGKAWFASSSDYHASTEMCEPAPKSFSNYIEAKFEFNEITGRLIITNECARGIFDFPAY